MSEKDKKKFIKGASGGAMLALHANRPDFLKAQTKTGHRAPTKQDLLNASMLDPAPQLDTFHDRLHATPKPLSQEPSPGTVKHGLSEGEDSVDDRIKVSLSATNFSVAARKSVAEKLGRTIPSVHVLGDGRIQVTLTPSSKGYHWSEYGQEDYVRFSASEVRFYQIGVDKLEKFGMTYAAKIEETEGNTLVITLLETLARAREVGPRKKGGSRHTGTRQPPAQPFPNSPPMAGKTVAVPPSTEESPITFGEIRSAVALLQRAQQSEEWSGMKLSVDEEGRIHAQVSWSL